MSYVKTDACSQEVPCFHTLLGNSELKLTSKKKKKIGQIVKWYNQSSWGQLFDFLKREK